MPVIASVAAGPLTRSTWFCSASGASCTATPDEAGPARIVMPCPIRSFAAEIAFAGSAAASASTSSIGDPFTSPVPSVAYSSPASRPAMYCSP
jgi:hypothetical protein